MEMEEVLQRKEEVPSEELVPPSNIHELDVKEWAMELRENNIVMDEFNVLVKEEKIKDQRRKLGEERNLMKRQNDLDEREKVVNVREKELIFRKQSIKEMEFEINEKNSFLEISLKLKGNEEKISQQKNRNIIEMVQNETQLMVSMEKYIAMREKEVALRHQKFDRKESQLEEKRKIFDMAIQVRLETDS